MDTNDKYVQRALRDLRAEGEAYAHELQRQTSTVTPEELVELENAQAGRFLAKGRYWLGYILVGLAYVGGSVAASTDLDFWWRVAITAALFLVYITLFAKFKKRSIN